MSNQNSSKFSLNRFLKDIYLKKQSFKKVQNKVLLVNELKERTHKNIGSGFPAKLVKPSKTTFVMYILEISFSKKNTLFRVSDCLGNTKFFYSAGSFQQKGKDKISRSAVLRKFYRMLLLKLKFLRKVPVAIHFKNTDSNLFWFLKRLKKKLFITVVKHFNYYPYNGCRTKKIKRKKFKSRSLNI